MELEVSLPCSQEPVTSPYPEPDDFSLHPHTCIMYVFSIRFNIPYLCLDLPSFVFLSRFPTKIVYEFLIPSI